MMSVLRGRPGTATVKLFLGDRLSSDSCAFLSALLPQDIALVYVSEPRKFERYVAIAILKLTFANCLAVARCCGCPDSGAISFQLAPPASWSLHHRPPT